MISIFDFTDYRKYLGAHLHSLPKQGYGQLRKLADVIGVHTSLISQILSGTKSMTIDQAVSTSDFFGLGELETEFFVGLVSLDRAGNELAKQFVRNQLKKVKDRARNLDTRLSAEVQLSEEQKAVFYSDWSYSAIRQITAIEGFSEADSIADNLGLPVRRVRQALLFLTQAKLCKEKDGKFSVGPSSTMITSNSPWARVHKVNWREKAIASLDKDNPEDLNYSLPMTLSENDVIKIRDRLVNLLEEIGHIVDPSPSETLYCLNLDWFKIKK